MVPTDAQGRFCLYQSTAMHTIVDVQGYFSHRVLGTNGSYYTPVAAQRTTDTRRAGVLTAHRLQGPRPRSTLASSSPTPLGL